MSEKTYPGNRFAVGDRVVFVPDKRTIGWHQHSFLRWGLYPGYRGVVTAVEGDAVVVDGKSDFALSHLCFKRSEEVSEQESAALRETWERSP